MPTEGEEGPLDHADSVLAAFEDASPQTATDVAAATGLDVESVRATLAALVRRDALCHKVVRGSDEAEKRLTSEELDALSVDLWYLPADRLAGGEVVVTIEDDGAVEEALGELALPGVSELMREWRRDAIRAAYEYLHDHGPAASEEIVDAVYPGHAAGYPDEEAWWDCVGPRLAELPGVDHDDEWRLSEPTTGGGSRPRK